MQLKCGLGAFTLSGQEAEQTNSTVRGAWAAWWQVGSNVTSTKAALFKNNEASAKLPLQMA